MTTSYVHDNWIWLESFLHASTLVVTACLLVPGFLALALAWRLYRQNQRLLRLVRHDSMTGALTHTETNIQCEREIERSLRSQQPFAVLEIDIDHFKNINDCHGHQVGDEVLAGLVSCAQKNLRMIDMFGRIGGEEFIAILPATDASGAVETAERLRKALETHIYATACGELSGITVSVGVTIFEPSDTERGATRNDMREQLFKQADDAMYEAKNTGRNRVVLWRSQSLGVR